MNTERFEKDEGGMDLALYMVQVIIIILRKNGDIKGLRPVLKNGAHARSHNARSIGVCYEGGLDEEGRPADTRTQAQRFALLDLLTILKHQYPEAQIMGHYQLSASIHKACPCFDSRKEYMDI